MLTPTGAMDYGLGIFSIALPCGTALELHRDVAFGTLPLDKAAAEEMIASLRASQLIAGFRGASGGLVRGPLAGADLLRRRSR